MHTTGRRRERARAERREREDQARGECRPPGRAAPLPAAERERYEDAPDHRGTPDRPLVRHERTDDTEAENGRDEHTCPERLYRLREQRGVGQRYRDRVGEE